MWTRRWGWALLCLGMSLGLAACSGTRRVYLENGAPAYLITCGGYFNSWESCLVKAGKLCRTHGYDTVRSVEYDRTLLISCKTP